MCPCEICFPDEGHCNTGCRDEHVGCPLIETEMSNDTTVKKADLFKIVQQPAYLPTLTNMYTEKAMDFIRDSNSENNPFFLYVAYHQLHTPQFAGKTISNYE